MLGALEGSGHLWHFPSLTVKGLEGCGLRYARREVWPPGRPPTHLGLLRSGPLVLVIRDSRGHHLRADSRECRVGGTQPHPRGPAAPAPTQQMGDGVQDKQ